ncbi:MAG: hypothetical protein KF703_15905 [Actinobacteria bacterium]|nr:hypothetical protein [Actinomycetota bacterium]
MVRGDTGASTTRRAGILAVVGVLALAACSSGSSDDAAASSSTTSPRRRPSTGAAPATSSTTLAPSTTSTPFDLRRADLSAGPYRVRCPGGEVDLAPGAPSPGVDDRPVVLDPLAPQFVDLTGDGRPEAVAEAACHVVDDPDAAVVRSVVVLAADAGAVVQMGQPLDGADPAVVGGSLAVGREASVGTDGAGQARSMVYEPFTFDGSSWVPGSDGVPVAATDPVTVDGMGPLVVGAPFGEVAIATGAPIEAADRADDAGACVDLVVADGPEGVDAVGGGGVVRAVHVENPAVRTDDGLGIGSTEVEVQFTFPGFVAVRPDPGVPGGRQLVVTSPDLGDRVLRFDTDGTVVTGYAAGEAGWADGAGGCG